MRPIVILLAAVVVTGLGCASRQKQPSSSPGQASRDAEAVAEPDAQAPVDSGRGNPQPSDTGGGGGGELYQQATNRGAVSVSAGPSFLADRTPFGPYNVGITIHARVVRDSYFARVDTGIQNAFHFSIGPEFGIHLYSDILSAAGPPAPSRVPSDLTIFNLSLFVQGSWHTAWPQLRLALSMAPGYGHRLAASRGTPEQKFGAGGAWLSFACSATYAIHRQERSDLEIGVLFATSLFLATGAEYLILAPQAFASF